VSARAVAHVNLAALERNCRRLAAMTPALCAVVKANAYGHGAVECARAAQAAGASWLAVAAADEACELREAGVGGPILVMGALSRAELDRALAAGADVVAWHEDFVGWARDHSGDGRARLHIKLDTGMGRLGTRDGALAEHLVELVAGAPELELVGAMTHLATADAADRTFLDKQLERFASWAEPLRARHPRLIVHAENSAGLLGARRARFDMVRAGGAVYGLDPFGVDPAAHGLEAVLVLESWVATRKPCARGESAGYGRTFVASEPTELAVVPVGYGDGVRRLLSNNACVLIGGRRRPVVGTVSMDNLTVDLGLGSGVAVGAAAVLIGSQGGQRISAEEIAARQGTINYEITCAISPRVPRRYHRDTLAPNGGE
jgi:alanine racemase